MVGRDSLLCWSGPQTLVLTTGIMRSGSTWVFNAARLLAGLHDGEEQLGFWIDEFDPQNLERSTYVVVKAHCPDASLIERSDLIFSSYRDFRDIAVSARDLGVSNNAEEQIGIATDARKFAEFWFPHSDLIFSYEDILEKPAYLLGQIAEKMNISVEKYDCTMIAERLALMQSPPLGFSGIHDQRTLLHVSHRPDGRPGRWRETLDPGVAMAITEAHGDWLAAHGYDT